MYTTYYMHVFVLLSSSSYVIVSINIYTTVIGEPPWFMVTQHPNVYVYVNNSDGDPQNL